MASLKGSNQSGFADMSVNLSCLDPCMTHQFLDNTNVCTVVKQMCRKTVTQCSRSYISQAGAMRNQLDGILKGLSIQWPIALRPNQLSVSK